MLSVSSNNFVQNHIILLNLRIWFTSRVYCEKCILTYDELIYRILYYLTNFDISVYSSNVSSLITVATTLLIFMIFLNDHKNIYILFYYWSNKYYFRIITSFKTSLTKDQLLMQLILLCNSIFVFYNHENKN